MKKWVKGFLIFGVTTSILGTCAMIGGAATGGIQSILNLSNRDIYQSTKEQDIVKQDIDKLDISLHHHSISIVDSPDQQVHIYYYRPLTGTQNFTSEVKNGTLHISDKEGTSSPEMGQGLELLLRVSQAITSRYKKIQIAIPRGKTLKEIYIKNTQYGEPVNLARIQVENLKLETVTYDTAIYNSRIKHGEIHSKGMLYISDSELSDMNIKGEAMVTLDSNTFHNQVTVEATQLAHLWIKKDHLTQLYCQLIAENGQVYETHQTEHYSYQSEDSKEYGKLHEVGEASFKDQLQVKSLTSDIHLQIIDETKE